MNPYTVIAVVVAGLIALSIVGAWIYTHDTGEEDLSKMGVQKNQ